MDKEHNEQAKKLSKLNIEKGKKHLKKGLGYLIVAGYESAVGAVGGAICGACGGMMTAAAGGNIKHAMLMGGLLSSSLMLQRTTKVALCGGEVMATRKDKDGFSDKVAGGLFKAGLALTALTAGLGVGLGAGTHKLTKSIINQLEPEHQIERPAESEPAPVIDEIQVEK